MIDRRIRRTTGRGITWAAVMLIAAVATISSDLAWGCDLFPLPSVAEEIPNRFAIQDPETLLGPTRSNYGSNWTQRDLLWLGQLGEPLHREEGSEDDSPDISEPGPDMGDFPNSAFTLPKGRAYIEMAPFTMVTKDRIAPAAYAWPYLLRYGVTDDVEFRTLGNGLVSTWGIENTTGFSPMIFDMKIHLWDSKRELLIPASSFEAYVLTDWGSPAFRSGFQTSVNMNFDFAITEKLNLEWTLGISGVQESVYVVTGKRYIPKYNIKLPILQKSDLSVNQFTAQWALEYEFTDRLQMFLHGYYDGAVFLQQGSGSVAGVGFFWKWSKRLISFGSCNAGLDKDVAPLSGQLGFAWAM